MARVGMSWTIANVCYAITSFYWLTTFSLTLSLSLSLTLYLSHSLDINRCYCIARFGNHLTWPLWVCMCERWPNSLLKVHSLNCSDDFVSLHAFARSYAVSKMAMHDLVVMFPPNSKVLFGAACTFTCIAVVPVLRLLNIFPPRWIVWVHSRIRTELAVSISQHNHAGNEEVSIESWARASAINIDGEWKERHPSPWILRWHILRRSCSVWRHSSLRDSPCRDRCTDIALHWQVLSAAMADSWTKLCSTINRRQISWIDIYWKYESSASPESNVMIEKWIHTIIFIG